MNAVACQYAVLCFRPYAETGEFVNVGLVLVCAQKAYLGYRCNARKYRRVSHFFPELDIDIFRAAMKAMEAEIERLKALLIPDLFQKGGPEQAKLAFKELTRHREGLISFGEPGVALAQEPEKALKVIYERYVERQFAQSKEYQEALMLKTVRENLKRWGLASSYQKKRIGNERFHLILPFAHERDGRIDKAIKPLNLDRKETTEIYQHGDHWLTNLKRLREFNHLPREIVFPVQIPDQGIHREAANKVIEELRRESQVIPIGDRDALREAVQIKIA